MLGETVLPMAMLSFVLDREEHQAAIDAAEARDEPVVQAEDNGTPRLSPQEKSILLCLVEGTSNKVIARKMDISEATVQVHFFASCGLRTGHRQPFGR
jgi:two-component system, NarL family, nitrate/nitrite response regulator NarL